MRRCGGSPSFGPIVAVLLSAAALSACSTGGGGAGDLGSATTPVDHRVLCGLVAELPTSASLLQRVDVRDPAEFTRVLNSAVEQYVAKLDQIAPRVEPKLRSTVTDVRRLVLAHQFAAANDARVPLDTWTADNC